MLFSSNAILKFQDCNKSNGILPFFMDLNVSVCLQEEKSNPKVFASNLKVKITGD